jgi:dipeptidase D
VSGDDLTGLAPVAVWRHFAALSRIPRPSGGEQAAAGYVSSLADAHGWERRADARGNLVVRVPATADREDAPVVVLQAHLDMVCEHGPGARDPAVAGVVPIRDGEWVAASGTTLGADNGIGVALALAAAEDGAVGHGPLELLCTVEEETGLVGVQALDPGLVRGRILLNLDSEEDGVLTIGCAGSTGSRIALAPGRGPVAPGAPSFRVTVAGAAGGHSGMDAHRGRANAIAVLARLLRETGVRVAAIDGGRSRNAIPREAVALVVAPGGRTDELRAALEGRFERVRARFAGVDDGIALVVEPAPVDRAWTAEGSQRLLDLLCALPVGVQELSTAFPGLVESSSNLGVVVTEGDAVAVTCQTRSSNAHATELLLATLAAAARLAGATFEITSSYPAWQPDPAAPLLAVARRCHVALFGTEPLVTAVHAGLECGVIGGLIPGMEMLSLGPTVTGAHSPIERVHVTSVERTWQLLGAMLEALSSADGR